MAENREFNQRMQERIEPERGAISRELHDELGQQVTAIKSVSLSIAQRAALSDKSIEASARLVMECADHIYDGMHRLIATLRPLALDRLGLGDALRDLVADSRLRPEHCLRSALTAIACALKWPTTAAVKWRAFTPMATLACPACANAPRPLVAALSC